VILWQIQNKHQKLLRAKHQKFLKIIVIAKIAKSVAASALSQTKKK